MQKQVIEIGGEALGVVVPDEDRLKFVAVKYSVWDLDSQRFSSADEVRMAIRRLLNDPSAAQRAMNPANVAA
ncbi:hypothetical protein GB928_010840 [Shinella curvata]|uniref:Uncharacterized protein n=1 Tax=Shinella curvata TaxID=1817964 RepID=A0ABT8XD63_9HYPH|nr:hypothetical protein [Shinella curvata]MCJ8055261.1 hypothetical protein [Shinella curvata]MDO6121678.1 hypothetical protein [Shinella curvata]